MEINITPDDKMGYSAEQMRIFLSALNLFATFGYENVSIGALAKAAKVKTSALYYFGGKSGLLMECYRYFLVHCHDIRLTPEEYELVLKDGTKEEIIDVLLYMFPPEIIPYMFQCLTIIVARLYIDNNARDVYKNDVDQSVDYLKCFFERGIELGRFDSFDVFSISMMCISFRLFGLQLGIINHDKIDKWHNIETNVFSEIKKLIPFKY